ncbi:uncharacterized protein LOC135263351 [Anguilla rostrata]|uniref:uncharacterized protein LOC135263351 n=1 Tax=Anguilla rostrata TaxID=7938 RepID=UPI0030D44F0F
MNTLQNNPVCSFFLNEDDARAIEDAIRAAIKVVLNVSWTISNKKMQEFQRMVAERDRENEILKIRMENAERELVTLRHFKYSVEQCDDSLNSDTDGTHGRDACLSTEENETQRACAVPFLHYEEKVVLSECTRKREIKSPYEGTYSEAHPQEREATACIWESPAMTDLNDKVTSERTTSPITSGAQSGGQPECGRTLTIAKVKEEPPDFESIYFKWEMSEESVRRVECESYPGPPPFAPFSQFRMGDSLPAGTQIFSFGLSEQPGERGATSSSCLRKRISSRERQQKYRERIRADPEKERAFREKDRNRHRNRRKAICDLPEHSQKLRRVAWREASRRHRARMKNSASR